MINSSFDAMLKRSQPSYRNIIANKGWLHASSLGPRADNAGHQGQQARPYAHHTHESQGGQREPRAESKGHVRQIWSHPRTRRMDHIRHGRHTTRGTAGPPEDPSYVPSMRYHLWFGEALQKLRSYPMQKVPWPSEVQSRKGKGDCGWIHRC